MSQRSGKGEIIKIKIYYHHTDCGGVVYYAKYLEFLEEARSEFLTERGILIKELVKQGVFFVVARQEIDYKSPVFYGDTLTIETRVTKVSNVRVNFEYDIKNQNNQLVSQAKTVLVFVDKDLKPKAMPDDLRQKLLKPHA